MISRVILFWLLGASLAWADLPRHPFVSSVACKIPPLQYDAMNRLTNVAGNGGSAAYGYDGAGNLQSMRYGNGLTNLHQYDAMNRLTNGDLYNAENRLIARTNISVTLGYDADGNRVAKTNSGTITYYLIDDQNPSGYAQVLAEYSSLTGGTAPSVTYSVGSQIIGQNRSGTVAYYGYDGQGSVRLLLNATTSTTATDTYDYDAWGMLLDGTGITSNSVRYTGQYWDSDLGMNYQRARYYKPNLGRFWTMDTYEGFKQRPMSLHRYLYCEADPVDQTDPTGRASTVAAQNGQAVHQFIGDNFVKAVAPFGVSGPSVVNILQNIPGFPGLPANLQGVVTALFPDLTDTATEEIYEIKPDNARSTLLGEAQLQAYIDLFNYLDPRPGKNWHRGTSYSPPLTVPINRLNYAAVVGAPFTPPGMILYHVLSVQQIVQKKAVEAEAGENDELEDDVGIASEVSLEGGL